jgi:hypothetical protein
MLGNDLEGVDSICLDEIRKPRNTLGRKTGVPAEIRTRHLPNTNQKKSNAILALCFEMVAHKTEDHFASRLGPEQTVLHAVTKFL